MPEKQSKPELFMSYSYEDEELVLHLVKDLQSRGIRAVYDVDTLKGGEDWQIEATSSLISVADCVLALITPKSIKSSRVMSELGLAYGAVLESKGQKLLLPVIYGNAEIPYSIKKIHAIVWKDNYKEVVDRIADAVFTFVEKRNAVEANQKPSRKQSVKVTKERIAGKDKTGKPPVGSKKKSNEERKQGGGERAKNTKEKALEGSASSEKRNHWLLKMNPETWEIEQLLPGDDTFFSTYYFGKKRPEYHLFNKIRIGDYVLGFASGNYQSIVCEMEVVKPIGPNHEQGESFEMVVNRLTDPSIPLNTFRDKIVQILPRLEQNTRPPELLFELGEAAYTTILSSSGSQDEKFEKIYQPFFLTEGNHSATRDQLDFENDYNSFASVIALKRVSPPLAIGLFGNWGSGKSFFMEKLSERIEEIAKSKDPEYVEHVVPVKFNSWHYSDTNLWASLTTQIFESLNDYAQKKAFGLEAIEAIYKDLNITGKQLEETKSELAANEVQAKALKQQKKEKEETIRQKKETLNLWRKKDFMKIVFSDPYIQNDFSDIKEEFKGEKLIDNIGEIGKKYAEVNSAANRVVKSFVLLKENSKGKWRLIWILAVLFGVAGWLALGPLKEVIQKIISGATIFSGLVLTWLVNFTVRFSPYFGKVNQFYKRLKSLKETVDKEKIKVRLKEHDELQRLQKDIEELKQEKASLELEQEVTEEKKEKLQNEIKEIGSGKMLANFLAGKSADDAYIKQLGIISWIRKDFSKLNELFQNQRLVQAKEADANPVVQIDRIVLYIDDLDRCNEDVVVKVLEAIHLLLAFPLFVVVVGVDPRWLNNALSEKYKNLFDNRSSKNNEKGDSSAHPNQENIVLAEAATSYDYLEKIFQIPFALKPINKPGREKLIQYLIRDEMAGNTSLTNKSSDLSPAVQETLKKEETTIPKGTQQAEDEKKGVLSPEEKTQVTRKEKERLVFTDAELTYMQKISPLFGQTPRTINRYINIYRIIKAHGNLKVVGSFSEDEFMPVMFILGVVVGHSAFAEEFIVAISETEETLQFQDFLKGKKVNKNLATLIKPMASDIELMPMENFKRNLELISRFSFRILLK